MDDTFYRDEWITLYAGDNRKVMRRLPEKSVQTIICSPPYWGLRDYGLDPVVWGGEEGHEHEWGALRPPRPGGRGNKAGDFSTSSLTNPQRQDSVPRATHSGQYCDCGAWLGQLGLEPSPQEYVAHLVDVFREARRVLRDDGTLWLNLGDSYAAERGGTSMPAETLAGGVGGQGDDETRRGRAEGEYQSHRNASAFGLKHKDLVGVPWRAAFALQDDGWWLRSEIIWEKPNPMPESVQDRPTRSHEQVFLFAKSERYFWDIDAVRLPHQAITLERIKYGLHQTHPEDIGVAMPPLDTKRGDPTEWGEQPTPDEGMGNRFANPAGRNIRTVWQISTVSYSGAHYAVFPPKLVEPMIKAATSEHGACGICGAPYKRVVVKGETSWPERKEQGATRGNLAFGENVGAGTQRGVHGEATDHTLLSAPQETVGWARTCEHEGAPIVPCVVMDCFGGSGTVAQVAQALSRRSVLIDLNVEYLGQQIVRTAQVPLGL